MYLPNKAQKSRLLQRLACSAWSLLAASALAGCAPAHQPRYWTSSNPAVSSEQIATDERYCTAMNSYQPPPMYMYAPVWGGAMGVPVQGERQLDVPRYVACMEQRGYTLH